MCKFLGTLPNFFQVWLSLVHMEKPKAFCTGAEHRAHTVFVLLWSFLQYSWWLPYICLGLRNVQAALLHQLLRCKCI